MSAARIGDLEEVQEEFLSPDALKNLGSSVNGSWRKAKWKALPSKNQTSTSWLVTNIGAFVGSCVGECPCVASNEIPAGLPGAGMPWKLPELIMRLNSLLWRSFLIGGAGQAMWQRTTNLSGSHDRAPGCMQRNTTFHPAQSGVGVPVEQSSVPSSPPS